MVDTETGRRRLVDTSLLDVRRDDAELAEFADVYEELGQSVTLEREQVEVGDWFADSAIALLGLAGVGSLVWFGRLPQELPAVKPDWVPESGRVTRQRPLPA